MGYTVSRKQMEAFRRMFPWQKEQVHCWTYTRGHPSWLLKLYVLGIVLSVPVLLFGILWGTQTALWRISFSSTSRRSSASPPRPWLRTTLRRSWRSCSGAY